MPTLILHLPGDLVEKENFEDILMQVNRDVGDPQKFKSRADYLSAVLRTYAITSLTSLRDWESNRVVRSPQGKMIRVPELKFWEGNPDGTNDGQEGAEVKVPVGKLQYDYLRRAVAWENTYQREIAKTEFEFKNVAELSRFVLISALLQAQAKLDEQRMIEEEREAQAEEPTEGS